MVEIIGGHVEITCQWPHRKRSRSEKPADVEDSPQGRRRSLHRTSRPPLAVPLLILLRRPPVHPVLASALSLSVGPLLPAVVAAVAKTVDLIEARAKATKDTGLVKAMFMALSMELLLKQGNAEFKGFVDNIDFAIERAINGHE
ncbi:hypothetical protein OPV22_027885 [Ensete ventricosum]|uniref:Uncharacterized protein n=1 Tax=Ensete ventricosum TaxID=4639 RepID=A0AAV8Q6M7_ENSVE|nr:hypothetical protein OPV22_027885 [Ensete ventricosum]